MTNEQQVKTFDFILGDTNGPVSATATVKAPSLLIAKEMLAEALTEIKVAGAPAGVALLCGYSNCLLHVRITPEAVVDDNNWSEVV